MELLRRLFAAAGAWVSRAELTQGLPLGFEPLETRLGPYLEAGYPVEFHPQGAVRLLEPPDIWCAEEIVARRAPDPLPGLAWSPLLLAETDSTNDVAREQGRHGAEAGLVVAAARQRRGRGRLGRTWESPRDGGLYVSILLRPDLRPAEAGRLTALSSVAAADAVEAVAGVRPGIKWPNDLRLGGGKLGGILIETEWAEERLAFAVVGIGLNVRQGANDFSPEVRCLATSLALATGRTFRRADLLVALLDALARRLAAPFAEVRQAWADSSLTLGQQVSLQTGRGPLQGQALGLDDTGALLLRLPSGEVEVVTAGDMQAA